MVQESKAQVVYDIAGKIKEPGKNDIFFPEYKGSPVQDFSDYKGRGFVAGLDSDQNLVLAGEISKQTGEQWMLPPLERTIEEAYSNAEFRKMLEQYWIHNDERILEEGFAQTDNRGAVKDGGIIVTGDRRDAKIDRGSVVNTLVSANVMERPSYEIMDIGINRFENGVASVGSLWGSVERSFIADADGPYDGGDYVVSAFARVPKETKVRKQKTMKIAEAEYREMQERLRVAEEKAKKYDSLKRRIG